MFDQSLSMEISSKPPGYNQFVEMISLSIHLQRLKKLGLDELVKIKLASDNKNKSSRIFVGCDKKNYGEFYVVVN